LKNGTADFDDLWNMGITLNHMQNYSGALPLYLSALKIGDENPDSDDITMAKLHSCIGSCLEKMADTLPRGSNVIEKGGEWWNIVQQAESSFREAMKRYERSIGNKSALFGIPCYGLAKNLIAQGRVKEGEVWLYETLWIESMKDGVHPTPLHDMIMRLHDLYDKELLPRDGLRKYHDLLRSMLMHLHCRGFMRDGNGGIIMQAVAKVLLLSGKELARPALALLRRGLKLVENHVEDVEDTSWTQLLIKFDIQNANVKLGLPDPSGSSPKVQSETWLLEGPWGIPDGSDVALGICLTDCSSSKPPY